MKSKLYNISISDPEIDDNCKSKMLNFTVGTMMCSTCLDNDNEITNAFKDFVSILENQFDINFKEYEDYRDTLVPVE